MLERPILAVIILLGVFKSNIVHVESSGLVDLDNISLDPLVINETTNNLTNLTNIRIYDEKNTTNTTHEYETSTEATSEDPTEESTTEYSINNDDIITLPVDWNTLSNQTGNGEHENNNNNKNNDCLMCEFRAYLVNFEYVAIILMFLLVIIIFTMTGKKLMLILNLKRKAKNDAKAQQNDDEENENGTKRSEIELTEMNKMLDEALKSPTSSCQQCVRNLDETMGQNDIVTRNSETQRKY